VLLLLFNKWLAEDLSTWEYSFSDGLPGTALAQARLGMARQGTGTIGMAGRAELAAQARPY
jgi:hypothetical protein